MNIIFIVADDLGWGDVGYHNKEAITPNIDSLAYEGTRFENFYVQPSCSPTRAAFMTGIYPYKIGIQRVLWPWSKHGIEPNFNILPKYLKKSNYETAIIGKWNLGHYRNHYLPTSKGFDYHYGSYTGSVDHYTHKYYNVHDLNENKKAVYDKGHIADLLTNKTIEKIKNRNKQKNFFYYIPFNSPHVPIKFPKKYFEKFKNIKDKKRACYLAMVNHLDFCIGKIFSCLKEEKILEKTLIWFSSDNGGYINSGSCNGEFAGGKANSSILGMGEGAIKAPNFIYYEPINEGKIDLKTCHAIDVLPTLCSLTNTTIDEDIDGIDIFSTNNKIEDRILIHILMGNDSNSFYGCCQKNKIKYVIFGDKIEVYNLEKDPFEKNNIIKNNPGIELKNHLKCCFEKYKPDPIMWHQPNGYPNNFIFPKEWNSNIDRREIKILSEELFKFNFELSPVNSLGYYNLM